MDMDGLKNAVIRMLAGEEVWIQTGTFANDMTTFASRDDVLTLLVHLGYLTYDAGRQMASIPNKEVSQEYVNAIRTMDWHEVVHSVEASKKRKKCILARLRSYKMMRENMMLVKEENASGSKRGCGNGD